MAWDQSKVDKWYNAALQAGAKKEQLDQIVQQKQADYIVKQGVSAKDVQTNPLGLRSQIQEVSSGNYKPELSTTDQKTVNKYTDVTKSVDLLEKNLNEIEVSGPITGRLAFLNKLTGGGVYPEVADYEALRKSLIGPLARTISGEVGVLTDKDISRAEDLLPKVTDAKKLKANKLKNLRQLIKEKSQTISKKNKPTSRFTIEAIE